MSRDSDKLGKITVKSQKSSECSEEPDKADQLTSGRLKSPIIKTGEEISVRKEIVSLNKVRSIEGNK